jgi:hypothetical protein
MKRWRHTVGRKRRLYPVRLPFYLLPAVSSEVVFDPSLRRAGENVHVENSDQGWRTISWILLGKGVKRCLTRSGA